MSKKRLFRIRIAAEAFDSHLEKRASTGSDEQHGEPHGCCKPATHQHGANPVDTRID
jgi:hypothetical protein